MSKLGFIGAGNMAQALIKGILTAKVVKPENIYISDIRQDRLELLSKEYMVNPSQTAQLAQMVDILILSVKPQNMPDVLSEIKQNLNKNCVIISIAAGITTSSIEAVLGQLPIIRVMPNTPALVGAGATGLFATDKAQSHLPTAIKLFSSVGQAAVVDDENLIDAVTAISGSGPAYYFLLMEEMIKTAIELGLDAETAAKLVLQTAKGAAALAIDAAKQDQSPAELRGKVTSKGGTTEAALKVLEQGGFSDLVAKAITRAAERSRELSA